MKKTLCIILCACMMFAFSAQCFAADKSYVHVKTDDGKYIDIEAYPEDTVGYIKAVVSNKIDVRYSRITLYKGTSALDNSATLGECGFEDDEKDFVLRYSVAPESSSSSSSSKSSSSSSSSKKSSSSSSSRRMEINMEPVETNPNTGADICASAFVAVAVLAGAAVLIRKKK